MNTTTQPSIVFMQTKPPTVSLSEIQLIGIGVSALALFCCCLVFIALIYRCGTDVDDEESGWSVDTLTKPNPMDRLTKQSSIGKTNGADADAQYNSQPQQQEEPTSAIISYSDLGPDHPQSRGTCPPSTEYGLVPVCCVWV
eukprot:TRINITY_DN713_c0_g1_i1.p2 TRINITY_DN713_c0_g1~~TRINITY_DN713_c0_g1_i1.p2  ORF type:complete len:141 (-),score=22.16 TRINITY_DN713_c0_g1_i1:424-846(-)